MSTDDKLRWASLALIFVGIFVIFHPFYWWIRSRRWVKTNATVISDEEKLMLNPAFLGGGPIQGGTSRVQKVRYRYEFSGIHYVGWRVTPHDMLGITDLRYYPKLKKQLAEVKEQDCITVFVCPDKPTRSLLTRDVSLITVMLGFGLILFGLFFLFMMASMRSSL